MDQQDLSSRAIMGMYFARSEANTGFGWLDGVANLFNSDQESETYKWLGQTPRMREWLGERKAKGFRGQGVTVQNLHYEDTIEFEKKDLRRDKTGQINARIGEFADQGEIHWGTLVSSLIAGGASTLCYDGQYFFDTDHSEGDSGTQSNKINVTIATLPTNVHGSVTAPAVEEFQQAMLKAVSQILAFKDDQGTVMNPGAKEFMVTVPPGLYLTAAAAVSQITTSQLAPNLNPNNVAGLRLDVQMDAESAWTDTFAVFRTDSPIKAFIRQQEMELELKVKAEGSEFEFDNDAWQFGIDTWRGAGYGLWQRSCQVTLV